MALDPSSPRSRRALLTAAAAAVAVTVAEAVVRPLPVAAAGDDGKPILVGSFFNGVQSTTSLVNKANNAIVLSASSNANGSGTGGATAIDGFSDSGIGVQGHTVGGTGVEGISTKGVGVAGKSDVAFGVLGLSDAGGGVVGETNSGYGVVGYSASGTGVRATTKTGTALAVDGKATFSRSGKATILAGHGSVDVAVTGGLAGTPLCFASLRTYRAGVAVAAVRPNFPSSGKIRIYLTKTVTSAITVAWIVIG